MILVDGLAAGGMVENYDALTSEGLRDHVHTWTSSAFLVLAHEYLMPIQPQHPAR
jgi:hypothetical protein